MTAGALAPPAPPLLNTAGGVTTLPAPIARGALRPASSGGGAAAGHVQSAAAMGALHGGGSALASQLSSAT